MHYLYSKNKDTDQLCSNCAADQHLCFHICKKQSRHGSYELFLYRCNKNLHSNNQITAQADRETCDASKDGQPQTNARHKQTTGESQ